MHAPSAAFATAPSTSLPLAPPQVAAAGALAISGDATISLLGTGGGASNNMLSAAGLVGMGGWASYSGEVSGGSASNNVALATGLPLLQEPVVASTIKTVMDAGVRTLHIAHCTLRTLFHGVHSVQGAEASAASWRRAGGRGEQAARSRPAASASL